MHKNFEPTKDIRNLAKLMASFHEIMGRLDDCRRWGEFPVRGIKQTSFQHSFFIALLTAHLAKREEEIGTNKLDTSKLIVHALIHDFSEGITGDVTVRFKSDPRLKLLHNVVEHEQTIHQIQDLNPLSGFLENAYNLPIESLEAQFFQAIEFLDYFLYALTEYVLQDNQVFAAVIFRKHQELADFAQQFPSIREIYTPDVYEWVKNCIEHESDLITNRRFVMPEVRHLNDMINALTHLIEELDQAQDNTIKKQEMVQMVIKSFDSYK